MVGRGRAQLSASPATQNEPKLEGRGRVEVEDEGERFANWLPLLPARVRRRRAVRCRPRPFAKFSHIDCEVLATDL